MKNRLIILTLVSAVTLLLACSKGKRIGARCNDGTRSSATGRGACSHHGGVDYWIYEND
jgi:hypothetical protein